MDEKILKAIINIRGKDHRRPCYQTIIEHFLKEGFDCSKEEIEFVLNRLLENGLIKNRGAIGKDSFFILKTKVKAQRPTAVNKQKMKMRVKIVLEIILKRKKNLRTRKDLHHTHTLISFSCRQKLKFW